MPPPRAYAERLNLSKVVRLDLRRQYWVRLHRSVESEVHASMSLRADVQTDVRRVRERFLCEGSLDAETSHPSVLDSWRRSQAMHIHTDRVELPYLREPNVGSRLARAAAPVLQRVTDDLA